MISVRLEPARLLTSSSTDSFAKRLLESADIDQPAPETLCDAPARIAALLADRTILVGAARSRRVSSIRVIQSSSTEAWRVARWAGLGILLGSSLAAAVVGVNKVNQEQVQSPLAINAPAGHHAPTVGARRSAAEAAAPSGPDDSVAPAHAVQKSSNEAPPIKPTNDDLAQELAILDAAKTALAAASPAAALAALDRADRLSYRSLIPEATVLRVRALVMQGRCSEARGLANTFMQQTPNSPVTAVLRAQLDRDAEK